MKTKKVTIAGNEYTIRELSWNEQMDFLDNGYKHRAFFAACLVEPSLEKFPNLIKEMPIKVGKQLFIEMNKLNKVENDEETQIKNVVDQPLEQK